jgi:hypothetical protein
MSARQQRHLGAVGRTLGETRVKGGSPGASRDHPRLTSAHLSVAALCSPARNGKGNVEPSSPKFCPPPLSPLCNNYKARPLSISFILSPCPFTLGVPFAPKRPRSHRLRRHPSPVLGAPITSSQTPLVTTLVRPGSYLDPTFLAGSLILTVTSMAWLVFPVAGCPLVRWP